MKIATTVQSATFLGGGLFVGTLHDGRPFIYQGGVERVRREDLSDVPEPDQDRRAWDVAMRRIKAQLDSNFVCYGEPLPGAPLELTGCYDPETGDWLLLWRIACLGTCPECTTPTH